MDKKILEKYEDAKKVYAKYGVDVDKVLEEFDTIPVSLQCWAGDDIKGFEDNGPVASENVVTGSYPYPARNGEELRSDIQEAIKHSPLKHKVALHSMYAEHHSPRNNLTVEDFREWIDWAKEIGIGLDFNTSFFTHPMMDNGNSVTSLKPEVRDFWIKCGIDSRKIALDIGRELNCRCYNNFWFPDGMKDITSDKLMFRTLLKDSLDKIFEHKYTEEESKYAADVVEGKVFGIGTESFVVGSHEFYLAYAIKNDIGVTLDLGHYHPTEDPSDKISAIRPFVKDIMLHVSRGVRWDSDHTVIENDSLNSMMLELKRSGCFHNVGIGLDFFDATINRVDSWVIGLRATAKAILNALLDPTELLKKVELDGDYSMRLYYNEEKNNLPFNDVWNYLLAKKNVSGGIELAEELKEYEENMLKKRIQKAGKNMKKNILTYKVLAETIDIIDNMYRLGWDERNGGNVSYLLDEKELAEYLDLDKVIKTFPLNYDASELKGKYFLATATGKYFRNTKKHPELCLGIFRVSENGQDAEIIWGYEDGGRSTSETYAHLMCHAQRLKVDPKHKVVIHTHPTCTLAMTHIHSLDEKEFTKTLWKVMTESIVVFPEGIGVLPWMQCGTVEIGVATAEKMKDRRLVVWGLHGIYGAGEDIDEAFGLVETVEKAADVYLKCANMKELNTISDKDLAGIAKFYGGVPRKGYLD